jgi:hypothetical protein
VSSTGLARLQLSHIGHTGVGCGLGLGSGARGAKKKTGTPVSKYSIFFMAFSNSPHLETPKNVIKNPENVPDFLVDFLGVKTFRHELFENIFCSVFELPSLKKRGKN